MHLEGQARQGVGALAAAIVEDAHELADFVQNGGVGPELGEEVAELLEGAGGLAEGGEEHALVGVIGVGLGRVAAGEPKPPTAEALGVVDVEQAGERAGDGAVGNAGHVAALFAELGEALAVSVELAQVDVGPVEEGPEGPVLDQVLGEGGPLGQAAFDVLEHGLLRVVFQLNGAAGGEARELLLDGFAKLGAGAAAEQSAETAVEAELAVGPANEVEHGQAALALVEPEAAAELLQVEGGALGGAQEEHGVDFGDVDALVEHVHGEEGAELAATQLLDHRGAFAERGVAGDAGGGQALLVEKGGHELGVFDGDAEAEGAHDGGVAHPVGEGAEHAVGAVLVGGVEGLEGRDAVAAAAKVDVR